MFQSAESRALRMAPNASYMVFITGTLLEPSGTLRDKYQAEDRIENMHLLSFVNHLPKMQTLRCHYDLLGYPSLYKPLVELDYFVPPDRWVSEGHRGNIVREYRLSFQSTSPTSLLHFRARLHLYRYDEEGDMHDITAQPGCDWVDYAVYGDREVEYATLRKAYIAAGIDAEWMEGGRGLEMNDAGWDVLRDWCDECSDPCRDEHA